jgi:HAMP domain-containing protein
MLRPLYSAEYGVAVIGGEISGYAVKEGLTGFDVERDAPRSMPDPSLDEVQSQVLDSFAGREGYFLSVYSPLNMPGMKGAFFNFVIDRTEQVKALDKTYSDERSKLILQQVVVGLVAIAVALAITLLGVRLLARRFITGPIEEMARISHDIMEGSFEGEIAVEERSDFADLQRLLKSGKMLVDRMCEEPPQ